MTAAAAAAAVVLNPTIASAHGESARGIGGTTINAIGGEVGEHEPDRWFWLIRYDRREYRLFSDAALLGFAARGEDVHQHAQEESVFVSLSKNVTRDLQLNLVLPYNRFSNFSDNGDDLARATGAISRTSASRGFGDVVLLAKYRFVEQDDNHVALLVGVKLPTGATRRRTDSGDIVGTHNQPGSGSVDGQFGLGYTGHLLGETIAVNADILARVNTKGAGQFQSGNALLADLALSVLHHNRFVPTLEFNAVAQQRDIEEGVVKRNSGVRSIFATIGATYRFSEGYSAFAGYSVPLMQTLPGIQNEERRRFTIGVSGGF